MHAWYRSAAVLALALVTVAGCSKQQDAGSTTTTTAQSVESAVPAAGTPSAAPGVVSTPLATAAPSPSLAPGLRRVGFTDIKGVDGEDAISQLAQLGVFDTTSGAFRPHDPIKRGEFIRWLVKANNALAAATNNSNERIRVAQSGSATFLDVPASNPNFPDIQGMADAGLLVGYDKLHFKPDKWLSREELIAILVQRDLNGKPGTDAKTMSSPPMDYTTDGAQISKAYWGLIHDDRWSYEWGMHNIPRIFGSIKVLHPQQNVTRSEAAVGLQVLANMSSADAVKAKAAGR
ncbi:MAG: hypothetical protein NVS1B14_04600 [Vulcanimicrobiaceae bacterium]